MRPTIQQAKQALKAAAKTCGVVIPDKDIERGARQFADMDFAEEEDVWDTAKEWVIN